MSDGRRKGNSNENDVCRALASWIAPELEPSQGYRRCPMSLVPFRRRSTSIMPVEGHWTGEGDILWRPSIRFPFCVEAKKHEEWDMDDVIANPASVVWNWWAQAIGQASRSEGLLPLLIFTRNRRAYYVLIETEVGKCLRLQPQFGAVANVFPPSPPTGSRRLAVPAEVTLCVLPDLLRTDRKRVLKLTR